MQGRALEDWTRAGRGEGVCGWGLQAWLGGWVVSGLPLACIVRVGANLISPPGGVRGCIASVHQLYITEPYVL